MTARGRIVDAARTEFLGSGIGPTRMDTIAKRAGMARPNVYRYFGTKQDLVKEVILREVRAVNAQRRATISLDRESADIMLASLVSGAELIRGTEFLSVTLRTDREQVTRFLISNDEDLFATQHHYWEPILTQARERGDLRADLDDDRIIRWFMSANFSLVTLPEMYPGSTTAWFVDFVIPPVLA
ncbi:helix-turn-helix transcriptional regulator [Rhodococcus sp. CX]|uniref:TetR/AcrR family transcriptional regulator n=1 Tax=Rhodococcus sp. CX TaxID=2789880 RepID=UPI0018CF245B|nr:helix-turn-helix domain-containing protein [Rhodococcus sp. CX]MBH0121095.1 helix-turn-helix transcriptional regulator [Rhodococcus sp. CX]